MGALSQREPGASGWPAGGLGEDHTGGGSVVADGAPVEGEADGDDDVPGRVVDDDGGRFDGRPVPGSIGEVVPNGCGVRNGDGVPLGDCGPTVEGDDDGGRVCGVVTPVWASAGAAVTARITSAAASASRPKAFFIAVLLRGSDGARTVPGTRRRDVGITASGPLTGALGEEEAADRAVVRLGQDL